MKKLIRRIAILTLILISIAVTLFFVTLSIYSFALDAPKPDEGVNNATQLIVELESYKSDHGTYPNSINELIYDNYLRSIPKANWRYEYVYWFDANENLHHLDFVIEGPHWYCYYSNTKKWELHDDVCY